MGNFTCPHPNGLFADPSNCMKYFQCYENVPDRKNCQTKEGQQLLFDPTTTWCDWPDRVTCGARPICDVHDKNCNHKPSEITTKFSHETTKPSHDFKCPHPNGLYPDPKNCMKYYQCYENTPQRMSCQVKQGQQLLYDPTTTWCDWPDRVTCGARPVLTSMTNTAPPSQPYLQRQPSHQTRVMHSVLAPNQGTSSHRETASNAFASAEVANGCKSAANPIWCGTKELTNVTGPSTYQNAHNSSCQHY